MDIFDLLFIALLFAAIISLIAAGIVALSGRKTRAMRIVKITGAAAGIYFGIVLAVSAATSRKILNPGDPQCNDDWCITVESADVVRGTADSYDVTLRIWSRARRVAQRENDVAVYLSDSQSHRFYPIPGDSSLPFNTLLQPGESRSLHRKFRVPSNTQVDGLVVTREGGALGCFPGCLVIGENEWLHKPDIFRLQ